MCAVMTFICLKDGKPLASREGSIYGSTPSRGSAIADYAPSLRSPWNDQEVCRFLDHGLYPNFPENQMSFLDSLKRRERFATITLRSESQKSTVARIVIARRFIMIRP